MKKLLIAACACLAVALAAPFMQGCSEDEDCSATTRGMMNANIYTMQGDTLEVETTIDTLTVTAYGTDSIIVNAQTAVADVTLPLRYATGTTTFVFDYNLSYNDTIVVTHTNTPYFVSVDCGYQMKQTIDNVNYTTHYLTAITINNSTVNADGNENLKIYY